jgi:hypothetical protein
MRSRLEEYLEEVSRPLPASERSEWRTEAEQHLTALIEAHIELGYSPEEATDLALARFGAAAKLGERMRAEYEKRLPMPLALKVVSGLWLLEASTSLLVFGLAPEHFRPIWLSIWGFSSLLIGAGVALRHPLARGAALWCSSLRLLNLLPVIYAILAVDYVQANLPQFVGQHGPPLGVAAFQIWVLTRPSVKALFETTKPPLRAKA